MAKSLLSEQKPVDGIVVSCCDPRLQYHVILAVTRTFGVLWPYYRTEFGGAKCLAGNHADQTQLALLDTITHSVNDFGVRHVVLLTHEDCMAYRTDEQVDGRVFENAISERAFHRSQLLVAGDLVRQILHGHEVAISLGFVRFSGQGLFIESVQRVAHSAAALRQPERVQGVPATV